MTPLHHILYPPTKYFVPPPVDEREDRLRYRIRLNPREQIIRAIRSNGGEATVTQIYNLTDGEISKALAMHHLQAMESDGVLECVKQEGKRTPNGGRCPSLWVLK